MKLLRGVLLGALIWVIIFIEISITMIGLKLPNLTSWIIHYVVLIPMILLVASLYYKKRDKVNGFLLGIIFLIVGIVLDMIVTVPLFIIPQGGNYMTYYSNIYMLIGFVETVVLAGVYDTLIRKKRR